MRIISALFIGIFFTISAYGQENVLSFSQADEQHISIETIDNQYPDAIHANPEQALFSTNQAEFIQEYQNFIQELAQHLNEYGFFWEEPTRIFNRIYFSKEGTVDYFFYNEEHAGFTDSQMEEFNKIVADFITNHSLNIESESTYAQCSPVVYANVVEQP